MLEYVLVITACLVGQDCYSKVVKAPFVTTDTSCHLVGRFMTREEIRSLLPKHGTFSFQCMRRSQS